MPLRTAWSLKRSFRASASAGSGARRRTSRPPRNGGWISMAAQDRAGRGGRSRSVRLSFGRRRCSLVRAVDAIDGSPGPTLRPTQEAPVTAPRRPIRLALALLLGVAALAVPAHASTQSELDDARDRLESAQAELDDVTALWQETEARLARAQDAAAQARSEID